MHSGREFLCGFIAIGGCRCTPFFIEEKLAVFHTKRRAAEAVRTLHQTKRLETCDWKIGMLR